MANAPHDFHALIQSAGRSDHDNVLRARLPESLTPDFDLHYTTRGRGAIRVDGARYDVEQGTFLLVQPLERFLVLVEPGMPFERIFIHFDLVSVGPGSARDARALLAGVRLVRAQARPEWRTLCLRALRDFRRGNPFGARMANLHLTELLAWLLEAAGEGRGEAAALDPRVAKQLDTLRRAEQFLRERYREPFSLRALCARLGLSVNHFTRLFRAYTGRTPYEYYLERKLEQAKLLLVEGGRHMEEVAREVGLGGAHHLGILFRRKLGESPTAYAARFLGLEGTRSERKR